MSNPIQFYTKSSDVPSQSNQSTGHLTIGTNFYSNLKETNLNSPNSASSQLDAPFKDANDIMLIKKEAARNFSSIEENGANNEPALSVASTATTTATNNKHTKTKHLNLAQMQARFTSRTNSNVSLSLADENSDPVCKHLLEHLKEENELLNIKVNKLRYNFPLT